MHITQTALSWLIVKLKHNISLQIYLAELYISISLFAEAEIISPVDDILKSYNYKYKKKNK